MDVRFHGNSGHDADVARCLLMTQSGRPRDPEPAVPLRPKKLPLDRPCTAPTCCNGLPVQALEAPRRTARKPGFQTTVPTIAPIPAVTAIARAPQKVTRTIGFKISAPPVLAPRKPSKARNSSDPAETIGISRVDGESRTRARGAIAPTENVAADVRAAWMGLAGRNLRHSELVSSMRA